MVFDSIKISVAPPHSIMAWFIPSLSNPRDKNISFGQPFVVVMLLLLDFDPTRSLDLHLLHLYCSQSGSLNMSRAHQLDK